MSARIKIQIAMILLALLPVFILGFITSSFMVKNLTTFQENSLNNIVSFAARYMSDFYYEKRNDIKNDAQMEAYKKVLEMQNDNIENQDDIIWNDILRKIIDDDVKANLGEGTLIDRNGKVILSYNPSDEGLMLDKTKLYTSIINGSEYYQGTVLGENEPRKMELAVPIKDDKGEIVGIYKRIINLQMIKQYIDDLHIGGAGYIILLGNDGVVLYHETQEGLGIHYNEFQDMIKVHELTSDFEDGKLDQVKGIIKYTSNGVNLMGVYEQVADSNWVVIAVIDENAVLGQVSKVRNDIIFISIFIGIMAALLAYEMSRRFTDPLRNLNASIKKIAEGDLTLRCSYPGHDEFRELCDNINHMADNLQKKEKELRMSVRIDKLTYLPNRLTIYEVLDTLMYKYKNQAIIILDLDEFKMLNESFGHEIGDKVLIEVGEILRSLPQDNCYPARLGGDEFLVFISDWTIDKYPERIAETIIEKIGRISFIDDIRVNICVSIGIEYLTEEKMDMEKLIKHSDLAMYKAKATGKNKYEVYSQLNKEEF